MINPLIAIRNSYYKSLKGEEKLWKVIWLWGVLLYFVVLSLLFLYSWITFNPERIFPLFSFSDIIYCIFLTLVMPLFMLKLFGRNIKNVNLKNRFLKKILALFLLFIIPLLFSVVNFIFIGTFLVAAIVWSVKSEVLKLFLVLLIMITIYANYRFYKNYKQKSLILSTSIKS